MNIKELESQKHTLHALDRSTELAIDLEASLTETAALYREFVKYRFVALNAFENATTTRLEDANRFHDELMVESVHKRLQARLILWAFDEFFVDRSFTLSELIADEETFIEIVQSSNKRAGDLAKQFVSE